MLDREGAAGPGNMVVAGDAAAIREGLERYKAAGTTEAAINILGDREAALEVIGSFGSEI